MSIQQLLQPSDEVVEDSPEDIDEQIAQLYEPVVEDDSEPEEVEVLPRIKADQALQLLRQLRLHEEQSDDCNSQWIRSLDSYEKVVYRRQFQGLQQRSIDGWLTST